MIVSNDTHKATVSGGYLVVRELAEKQVRVITPSGTTIKPFSEVFHGANPGPLFSASYSGPGYASVDFDAGMQRWRGVKSLRAVRLALYRCGFTPEQATSLLRTMKKREE